MRYVLDERFDDLHQECRGIDCYWQGGRHDEPFTTCPLCGSGLRDARPPA